MTCLSETRDDVEEDIFFIEDFGIGIVLGEFDTVYFCGLHFHGGTQPRYLPGPRVSDECHVRLTQICYGPSSFFDTPGSEAFITLPGKEGVLKICNEMKDWSAYMHFERVASSQATYTSDGEALMESGSNFAHFVRDILQLVAYAVDQYPRHEAPRFNRRVLLSAFSSVRDGKRVGVEDWELGPGWSDEDTQIGTEYKDDLKSLELPDLMMLHHSDAKSTYPYGNEKVHKHAEEWKKHHEAMTLTIPLCVASDLRDDETLQPNANRRRTTTKNVRSGKASTKAGVKSITKSNKSTNASANVIQPGKVTIRKRKRSIDSGCDVEAHSTPKRRKTARKKRSEDPLSQEVVESSTDRGATAVRATQQICTTESVLAKIFGEANLQAEITSLVSHIAVAARTRDQADTGSVVSQMKVLLARNDIHTIWQLKLKMELKRSSLEVEATVNRAQLLMLYGATWAWLDHSIESAYKSLQTGDDHWMKALAIKIDSLLLSGNGTRLDPSAFFPALAGQARPYQFKAISMSKRASTLANFDFAVRPVIMSWFGFTSSTIDAARGFFVRRVIVCVGVGALYLPSVWDAYERLARTIDPVHRKPTKRVLEKWKEVFASTLSTLGTDLARGQLQYLSEAFASVSIGAIDDAVWNRLSKEGSANNLQAAKGSCGTLLGMSGLAFRPEPLPIRNEMGCFDDMLRMFINQIETLYPLLDAPGVAPQKPPRNSEKREKATYRFLDLVFKNTDKKLPFRDLAASRRRILEDDGPFSPPNLRTRKGFFSAMVHRGITHHSPFLVGHGETMFSNLDDFKAAMASYGRKEKTFFCDPSAYGMWTRLSVSAADTYWKSSGKKEHRQWLSMVGEDRLEFTDLYRKFSSADFPNIGPLIGFLLASDYAIAGVVKEPTVKEMGGIIYDLGKGGLTGLMMLGFKCDTREDTVAAFESLYKWTYARIEPHRRKQMGFSVFVLEHMLCKFKRLTVKAYLDIEGNMERTSIIQ